MRHELRSLPLTDDDGLFGGCAATGEVLVETAGDWGWRWFDRLHLLQPRFAISASLFFGSFSAPVRFGHRILNIAAGLVNVGRGNCDTDFARVELARFGIVGQRFVVIVDLSFRSPPAARRLAGPGLILIASPKSFIAS